MNTLDQQRAKYAWERANSNTVVDGYREMVKGAPALVMGNGLMATLAYYRSRTGSNERAASVLLEDTLGWLAKRQIVPSDIFALAMNEFFKADAQRLMRATDETLAMLRWLRQFAVAVESAR